MAVNVEIDDLDLLVAGLRIVVTEQGTTITVALEGEWDLAQDNKMRQSIQNVLARTTERLQLDLTRLSFMDSTGIRGVNELARAAAREGVEFVLVPGPRAVRRLFELCPLPESVVFMNVADGM